nr:hypothetical protein [Methylobacterium sp. ZNC0032]
MEAEGAPPLGILIAFWAVLVGVIAVACAPVLLALLVIFGAH